MNFIKNLVCLAFARLVVFLFLISGLFISVQSEAEELKAFECQSEISSKLWSANLTKVQKAYQGLASFQGDFRQDSYLAALDMSEKSAGKIWFAQPGRMRWEYAEPEEQLFLIKDQTLWLYQPVDQQVIIEDFQKFVLSDLPLAFLMGLGDLTKDFEISRSCNSLNGIIFNLIPKQAKSSEKEEGLQQFTLLVGKNDFLPRGAQVQDLSGNINSVTFLEPLFNRDFAGSLFDFSYPDGVDVSDQRGD